MAVIGLKRKHSHRNKAKKQQHPEILLKMSLTNTHTPKYVWVGKFPWPHRNCTICIGCDNIRILNATLLHLRLQVTRAIFTHSQQQTHLKIKEKTNRVQHLQLAEFHMISQKWLCEKSRNAWNCVDLFVGSEFSKCVCVCDCVWSILMLKMLTNETVGHNIVDHDYYCCCWFYYNDRCFRLAMDIRSI